MRVQRRASGESPLSASAFSERSKRNLAGGVPPRRKFLLGAPFTTMQINYLDVWLRLVRHRSGRSAGVRIDAAPWRHRSCRPRAVSGYQTGRARKYPDEPSAPCERSGR